MNSTAPPASAPSSAATSLLMEYSEKGKLTDLATVLEFLKNPSDKIKILATQTASGIIKENLLVNFKKMEVPVRKKLVQLLESLHPRVIDDISQDLFNESPQRRLDTVQLLGLLKKNPRIRDILASLIKDRDVKIRATAVHLLGRVIGPNDFDIILKLLNDPDKRVKANTIEALEQVNNKRLVPVLLRFRKDPSNRIRGNILKALFNLGFTDIEPDLLGMLNNASDLMKASALWVVSQLQLSTVRIVDSAGRLLLSDSEMVVRNAKNALVAQGTPRAKGYLRYLSSLKPDDPQAVSST